MVFLKKRRVREGAAPPVGKDWRAEPFHFSFFKLFLKLGLPSLAPPLSLNDAQTLCWSERNGCKQAKAC